MTEKKVVWPIFYWRSFHCRSIIGIGYRLHGINHFRAKNSFCEIMTCKLLAIQSGVLPYQVTEIFLTDFMCIV